MALSTADQIQEMYIAYYGRPADPAGLEYWTQQAEAAGGFNPCILAFGSAPEATDLHAGMTTEEMVNSLYNQLFGRDAEAAGLAYWTELIDNGTVPLVNAAWAMINGAQGTDADAVANKLAAANDFTTALDTDAEIAGYSGNTAAATARTWLATVDETAASLTAAEATMDDTINDIVYPAVPGQTFTLTTGTDTFIGTSADDTFTSAAGTLQAADIVIDQSSTDYDVMNVTLTAAGPAAHIEGVETINVSWDSFNAAAIDATNITGATINMDTTKPIFTAGTTVTALGSNNLDMGSVMAGALGVTGVATATIDAGAATTVTVTAEADEAIAATVVANSATTVNVNGNTTDADTVEGNTADITIGRDATVNVDDIASVTLNVSAAATVDLTGTTDVTAMTVAGAVDTELDAAELLDGATITNSLTTGTLTAIVSTDAVDASDWANTVVVNLDNAAVNDITVASGATVQLAVQDTVDIAGVASTGTTNVVTLEIDTAQTSVTLSDIATATVNIDTSDGAKAQAAFDAGTADVTVNVSDDFSEDATAEVTYTTFAAADSSVTFAGTGDVTVGTSIDATTVDASGLTGALILTDVLDSDAATVYGGSGANNVTMSTIDGDATYVGQDGGDTITIDDIAGDDSTEGNVDVTTGAGDDAIVVDVTLGKYATIGVTSGDGDDSLTVTTATSNVVIDADMGEDNDTVIADSITTSSLTVNAGAGDDSVSATALTSGVLDLVMGDGDDTVTTGSALVTNAALVVDLGNGDDRLVLAETDFSGVNLLVTGGTTGTDTVATTASTSFKDANLIFTNVDTIEIADTTTATFQTNQLSGKTYTISSSANAGGGLAVVESTAGTNAGTVVDLSSLTIDQSISTGVAAVAITTGSGNDTITGTNGTDTVDTITAGAGNDTITAGTGNDVILGGAGNDTINAGAGDDTITGGTGVDSMTGGTGADSFVIATGDTGITLATADTIIDFTTADDALNVAAIIVNTIANGSALADFDAFVTAAEASFAGTVDSYTAYNAAGSGNAWIVIDEDNSGAVDTGDTLIVLTGVNLAAEIVAGDFV